MGMVVVAAPTTEEAVVASEAEEAEVATEGTSEAISIRCLLPATSLSRRPSVSDTFCILTQKQSSRRTQMRSKSEVCLIR